MFFVNVGAAKISAGSCVAIMPKFSLFRFPYRDCTAFMILVRPSGGRDNITERSAV
jgi:hypothetical protein